MEELAAEKLEADREVGRLTAALAEAAAGAEALRSTSGQHGAAVREAQAQAADLRDQLGAMEGLRVKQLAAMERMRAEQQGALERGRAEHLQAAERLRAERGAGEAALARAEGELRAQVPPPAIIIIIIIIIISWVAFISVGHAAEQQQFGVGIAAWRGVRCCKGTREQRGEATCAALHRRWPRSSCARSARLPRRTRARWRGSWPRRAPRPRASGPPPRSWRIRRAPGC